MILENQKEAKIFSDGEQSDSIKMSLDLDSAQILMQMLSKNLYSDSIGSTIRECASNALDSHRRANIDEPIMVSLMLNKEENFEFCVEDFGVGLSTDDVEKIISKYGKSTKRNSNTELGMMGLGFKAPLAYSSSFYFVCRKDGIESKYMMFEGEDGNTIDNLYTKETKEKNGVKIIVPVEYKDRHAFVQKIQEQLPYFENVYFIVDVYGSVDINNDFNIYRGVDFQYSEMNKDRDLHICLDNVYYPLDYQKLGIKSIPIPIGLRFNLSDKLFPTPNRESLRYTQEAKEIILDKIALVSDELVTLRNDAFDEDKDVSIKEIFKSFESDKIYVNINDKITLDITSIVPLSNIKIKVLKSSKYSNLNLKEIYRKKEDIFFEYETKLTFSGDRFYTQAGYRGGISYYNIVCPGQCFISNETLGNVKKSYLREEILNGNYISLIKKVKSFKLLPDPSQKSKYNRDPSYFSILRLDKYTKDLWRTMIQEFQLLIKEFIDGLTDLDNINPTEEWLEARKKTKFSSVKSSDDRIRKVSGQVNVRIGEELLRYSGGRSCKFVSNILELSDFTRTKGLLIYSEHSETDLLDGLYSVSKRQDLYCYTFSPRELKIIKEIEDDTHNLMSIEKFMEGKTKTFKRIVTAHLIKELQNKYRNVFSRSEYSIAAPLLYKKIQELSDYASKNHSYGSSDMYKAMLEVAEKHNLFDPEMYNLYLEIKASLEKLYFLDIMLGSMSGNYSLIEDITMCITDLFKYHKFRLDWTAYKPAIQTIEELEETVN